MLIIIFVLDTGHNVQCLIFQFHMNVHLQFIHYSLFYDYEYSDVKQQVLLQNQWVHAKLGRVNFYRSSQLPSKPEK